MLATSTLSIAEYLSDPCIHPPKEIEMYLNGNCHLFTAALHQITHLQIVAILEPRKVIVEKGLVLGDGLVHCFCMADEKKGLIFDAKGIRNPKDLNAEYPLDSRCFIRLYNRPKELVNLADKDGWDSDSFQKDLFTTKQFIVEYYQDFLNKIKNVKTT